MSQSSDGRLFYTVGPETWKVRPPSFVLALTVTVDLVVDDLSLHCKITWHACLLPGFHWCLLHKLPQRDGQTESAWCRDDVCIYVNIQVDDVVSALRQREFKVSATSAALTTFIDGTANQRVASSGMKSTHSKCALFSGWCSLLPMVKS